ncbi:MAG: hypothetical protein AB7Y46_17230 [Armatimonadota bacterium]
MEADGRVDEADGVDIAGGVHVHLCGQEVGVIAQAPRCDEAPVAGELPDAPVACIGQ